MANRASVSITIGGELTVDQRARLVERIAFDGLSTEWDGPPFDAAQLPVERPLTVCAHDVAWGMLPGLEAYCIEQRLPFRLWYDSYSGEWTAGRTIFTGAGAPQSYTCDDEDVTLIDRATVVNLGSIEAIIAHFDAADFTVPPLICRD